MVTDVKLPIIAADFLANFSLLVDDRNHTLEQGHVPIDISPHSIHTVPEDKDNCDPDAGKLLAEFPDLTPPTRVPQEVQHNTVHNIKTTPGSPVSYRPRRLAPNRLAIAKTEFEVVLIGGILGARMAPGRQRFTTFPRKKTVDNRVKTIEL